MEAEVPPGAMEVEANDVSMHDTQSSEPSVGRDDSLEALYPCLGSPPPHWREDLEFLLQNLGRTYLNDMTTEFTQEACQRLPSLVNTMVQSISRVSGSLLSCRAISYNYEDDGSVKAYSTVTESINECMDERTNHDDMSLFMDLAFRKIGQRFERQPARIVPTIYTSPAWRGRPVLCPKHPDLDQRKNHLRGWAARLQLWQGIKVVGWEELAANVAKGYPAPFAPHRMYPNLPWHLDLDDWSEENVNDCYDYVLVHQRRLYAGDLDAESTAPQFMEKHVDEPYRREGIPTPGEYDEHSVYYYEAVQHFQFGDNDYMPMAVTNLQLFTASFLAEFNGIMTAEVKHLCNLVELNELLNPHERDPSTTDPPLLLLMPIIHEDLTRFIRLLDIPASAYKWNDINYNLYNILSLWLFVGVRKALVHEGKVAGGLTGAFRVALCLCALLRLKHDLQEGRIPRIDGVINWGPTEDQQIALIAVTLSKQIQDAIDSVPRPAIHRGSISDQWAPVRVEFRMGEESEETKWDWPYGAFGAYRQIYWVAEEDAEAAPREPSPSNVSEREGVRGTTEAQISQERHLTPPPASIREESDAMMTSPPRIAIPTRAVPAVQPIVTTIGISIPANADDEQRLSSTVSAELPPLPPSAASGIGNPNEDNVWQPYRAKLERNPNLGVKTHSTRTYGPSGVLRPQTEKIRTAALPPISEGTSVRRSLSMGRINIDRESIALSENTLGLQVTNTTQVNAGSSGQDTGDTTIGNPLDTSTPTHKRDWESWSVSVSTRSSSRTPAGHVTPRTVSLNVEQADRTVTGSLLDVAAKLFAEPEGSGSSSSTPRQPAVTTASTRRIITRHVSQSSTAKRALPDEGKSTSPAKSKKSKSHERDRNRK